jgi:hypothetical protein
MRDRDHLAHAERLVARMQERHHVDKVRVSRLSGAQRRYDVASGVMNDDMHWLRHELGYSHRGARCRLSP